MFSRSYGYNSSKMQRVIVLSSWLLALWCQSDVVQAFTQPKLSVLMAEVRMGVCVCVCDCMEKISNISVLDLFLKRFDCLSILYLLSWKYVASRSY